MHRYAGLVAVIQIRGISSKAHRRLKERAAGQGQSLSEYLRLELEQLAAEPALEDLLDEVAGWEPVIGGESAADAVRAEREARDEALVDRATSSRSRRSRRSRRK